MSATVLQISDTHLRAEPNTPADKNPDASVDNLHAVFGALDSEVGEWRVLGVESLIAGQEHGSVDVDSLTRRLDRVDDRLSFVVLRHPAHRRGVPLR